MAGYIMNKKIFLVIVSVFLAIVFISISRPHVYKKKTETIADRLPLEKEVISSPVLVPVRPEDYGMVVFEKSSEPASEGEINALIHRKMQDIKTQFPEEVLSRVRERIKEDPQKTKEKLAQIEEAILRCRQILKDDPYNEEARNRLQNLLMLKSIAKELPER